MKKSDCIKEFDSWVENNYTELERYAKNYHSCANDLIHHVYLNIRESKKIKLCDVLNDNPMGYFTVSMYHESISKTPNHFKKLYETTPPIYFDVPVEDDQDLWVHINREQLEIFTTMLGWFDEQVFRLWLRGYNISEVSRESGIALETLHTSLYRTKKKVKNAFDYIKNKK